MNGSAPAPGSDAALTANGALWLGAVMHCFCCKQSSSCGLAQCQAVRGILTHIHSCPPSFCTGGCGAGPAYTPVRALQVHWLECKDSSCGVCLGVHQGLGKEQQQQQQQQQQRAPQATTPAKAQGTVPLAPPSTGLGGGQEQRLAQTCPPHRAPYTVRIRRGSAGAAALQSTATKQPTSGSISGSGKNEEEGKGVREEGKGVGGDEKKVEVDPGASSPPAFVLAGLSSLEAFAQYLLQSLLRWQGADTPPTATGTHPRATPAGDAAGLECLQRGRALWIHLLRDCPRLTDVCSHPGCMETRRLLLHMLSCQDTSCTLCVRVKECFGTGPLAAFRDVHNKASDMQVWMQDLGHSLQQLTTN